MSSPRPLRVGYLVNRYPAVSHAFIRREIAGVEARGIEVFRYSIRATSESEIVDPADRLEQGRTRVLLQGGLGPLLGALLVAALFRPIGFLKAAAVAWSLGIRSNRRIHHLAYLAEACRLRGWLRRDSVAHLHAHFGTNPATVALLCRIAGPPFQCHGARKRVNALLRTGSCNTACVQLLPPSAETSTRSIIPAPEKASPEIS